MPREQIAEDLKCIRTCTQNDITTKPSLSINQLALGPYFLYF